LASELLAQRQELFEVSQTSDLSAAHEGTEEGQLTFYTYLAPILLVATLAFAWRTRPQFDSHSDESLYSSPQFKSHRLRFLVVWGMCVGSDWLQGPYVYELYASLGYSDSEINRLFVVGFVSSMIFGTFVGSLADSWGRKRMALVYCLVYIVSCMCTHCSLYPVLIVGRITGGIATSLLFSVFECWLVSEHNDRHQFGAALLRYMFSMMYFVSYLVAVFSSLVAHQLVSNMPLQKLDDHQSLHYGGNTCAYDLAIVLLFIALALILATWDENYGETSEQTVSQSYSVAMKAFSSSWRISAIGLVQACFEGSMYAFVLKWTPALSIEGAPRPPHGIVFSTLMMCCMMGSSSFSGCKSRVNAASVVLVACVVGAGSFGLVALKCEQAAFVAAIYLAFLCFEGSVGLYYPSIGALKSEWVPEAARAGIYNLYRVPLNIVTVCIVLLDLSLSRAFAACAILCAVAATILALMVATAPAAKEEAVSDAY